MSSLSKIVLTLIATLLVACNQVPTVPKDAEDAAASESSDWHSFANPSDVKLTHLSLDLSVDFERRELVGTAALRLDRINSGAATLALDTRDLTVERVSSGEDDLRWKWGAEDDIRGRELIVQLQTESETVQIKYRTSAGAAGLQWLSGSQTTSGQPFLFTQSQPIQARSWIPLQDTPQVRFTYDARIEVPAGLRAVMSANNPLEATADGVYTFSMPQPIPSYLMALAAGRLDFKAMGDRTGVFAEPSVLDDAAAEFADTERMMEVGEALYGPYRWGRYDLLILPPSFPFGGMENPRLSFITPTVIAGDKSLVALIAHELAHSWSGNLVTNATWNDLWLNEGFTVYFESRIMEAVYGARREAMEAVLGYQSLIDDFEDLEAHDERLHLDLADRDPDDAFSNVPYEKGRLFLVWLERAVGRDRFDAYLRGYFDRHAFASLTTDEFVADVQKHLLTSDETGITEQDIDTWLRGTGLPDNAVIPESDAFAAIDRVRDEWLSDRVAASDIETEAWSVHEWLYFLNNLPQELAQKQMRALDETFQLTTSRNSEIAHSWLRIAIRNDYQPAFSRLREYLVRIGRRKLIVPLYEDLARSEAGLQLARDVFAEARAGYHPLTVGSVEKALDL